jgi:N-carbamoylputrescine amidase
MPRQSSERKVVLGLIQMRCERNPACNLERAISLIRSAASQGARIICLQELFSSQYFCQSENHVNFSLAEPIPGPTTRALARVARQKRIVLIAPLFERRAKGLYHNSAAILDTDGRHLGTYRKMHIPDDPLYYEKFYFAPGDVGFRAWDTRFGRIGVLICWDQWYPEAARLTALQGAEILFYPTAIGWHPREKSTEGRAQHDAWEIAQRAHAISNGCFVVAVNRVGHERPAGGDGIEFWGQSFVADPFGRILARAAADREEILVVPIDLREVETTRTSWPFLRDRRIDAYGDVNRRFGND